MQKTRQHKKHPARQITMRSTRWAHAVDAAEEQQSLQSDATLENLLTVHPDWPFDNVGHSGSLKGREPAESSLIAVRARPKKASPKPPSRKSRSEVDERGISDAELDAQIAGLSWSDRAKLYRYAAQELRRVPHFEADEGSAAWGRACRGVMRKLRACGQTLDGIEDGA